MRAGESEYERIGIINTNPVAKTSIDNGLSEKGKRQSLRAAFDLKEMGACDNGCWIWPSITQRAYQTAEIIAAINGVTRRSIDKHVLVASILFLLITLLILYRSNKGSKLGSDDMFYFFGHFASLVFSPCIVFCLASIFAFFGSLNLGLIVE